MSREDKHAELKLSGDSCRWCRRSRYRASKSSGRQPKTKAILQVSFVQHSVPAMAARFGALPRLTFVEGERE
jgi:hypothetical protein